MIKDSTVSCYDGHSNDYDVYQSAVVPHYQEMLDMVALACSVSWRAIRTQDHYRSGMRHWKCFHSRPGEGSCQYIPSRWFRKMFNIAPEKISSRFPFAVNGNKVADLSSSDWNKDSPAANMMP